MADVQQFAVIEFILRLGDAYPGFRRVLELNIAGAGDAFARAFFHANDVTVVLQAEFPGVVKDRMKQVGNRAVGIERLFGGLQPALDVGIG